MPKAKGKGGKKNKRAKGNQEFGKRELVFKEDGQEYGQVLKMLGNGRCDVQCMDGTKRLCHICGKMRKRVLIYNLFRSTLLLRLRKILVSVFIAETTPLN